MLFILWLAAGAVLAGDTNTPPPSLFAPNVKRVDQSGSGYWLTFADGKRAYATPTRWGWRVDYQSGRTVYVDRTNDGWREMEAGNTRYWSESGKGYSGTWFTEADRDGVSASDKATGQTRRFQKSHGSWSAFK